MHLFAKILSLLLPLSQCDQEVHLTSNSPAVLDAPITFYGRSVLVVRLSLSFCVLCPLNARL